MGRDTWVLLFLLRHSRCCNVGVVLIKVTIFGRSTNRRTYRTKQRPEITVENSAMRMHRVQQRHSIIRRVLL